MRALGMVTFEPKLAAEIGRAIAMNPELTLRDLWNLFARVRWNMELLWPEFCRVDLAREIPAVDVPVFFVAGEHDWLTSPELARQYLDALRAPGRSSSCSLDRATSRASRSRGGSWRSCCGPRRRVRSRSPSPDRSSRGPGVTPRHSMTSTAPT
jgi:hypothetical protein